MSQISTTLTVKEGSTTKSVKLYSSTSDMQGSSYKAFIVSGSTVYAAATSDTSSDQYKNYGTGLKYLNNGTLYYICTEPYVPSYSGSLIIPAQTMYNNSSSSAYETNIIEVWSSGSLSGGLKSGDKIVIPAVTNAFRVVEGTGSATSSFSASSCNVHLCTGYSTGTGSITNSLASWTLTGHGVPGGEGDSTYVSITSTTINVSTTITQLLLVCQYVQLIARAQLSIYNQITLNIN